MAAQAGSGATDWPAVTVVIAAGVVCACQMGKVPAALPVLRAELGLDLAEGAWIISVFNILGIVIGMACGALGDRVGHRRAVLAGIGLLAAGSTLGAHAGGLATVLASRVVEGIGFVLASAAIPPLLLRLAAPRDARLVYGIWGGYWPAGVAVMVLATPALIDAAGWRGLWLANAAVSLVSAAAVAWVTRGARTTPAGARRQGPPVLASLTRIASSAGPQALALAFAAYATIHVGLVSLLPSFYVEAGVGLGAAASLTALVAAVNVAGNVAGGLALQRGVARGTLVGWTFAALGVLAIAAYLEPLGFGLRLGAAIALSAVAGTIPAALLAGAMVHAPTPQHVGATTGLIMQGSQLGQFTGPLAMAWVVSALGTWSAASIVLVAAAAAGIAIAVRIGRLERR